mgnify:CR=1 FL=1
MQDVSLTTLFFLFLRMGSIGFGGPIALISLMEQECSEKRKWISLPDFNERYVFAKLMPGPIASQMAIWMGYHVRGRIGGLVTGVAFLLPAFCLILILSVFYQTLTSFKNVEPLILGMEAGALVIIFESVRRMFVPYVKEVQSWTFAIVASSLMLFIPRWEPLIILTGGALIVFYRRIQNKKGLASFALPALAPVLELFWIHFKAGFTVFGTGLAAIPVLQHEVVDIHQWMSSKEFLDGIAFGQITPGPVTITSVFIGYKTAGLLGAISACIGMYGPGAILILGVMPLIFYRLKGKPFLADFQQGAIPTVIGCIFGAMILLAQTILTPKLLILVAILTAVSWKAKLPGWATILLGSLLNFGASFLVA